MIRAERSVSHLVSHPDSFSRPCSKLIEPERVGHVGGDIEAISGDESGDTYVVIRRKNKNGNADNGPNGEAQA